MMNEQIQWKIYKKCISQKMWFNMNFENKIHEQRMAVEISHFSANVKKQKMENGFVSI